MSDNVNKPSHYNAGEVETIDGIRAALGDAFLDYCRGNVLKYVWRCRHKGKLLEDLRKAAKYLEWAIEAAEGEKPSEPKPLAIPDGWRELEFGETRLKTDLYSYGGKWNPYTYFDPAESESPKYDKRIHQQHIRKIETDKPGHVEGVWVEEADANASKIKPTETSDASIPDPGEGYRLLSKDPPERVVKGDEFWQGFNMKWVESENFMDEGCHQYHAFYYRRKIEPTEWIPKVGDRVRVNRPGRLSDGKIGVIVEGDAGEYTVRISGHNLTSRNLTADDLELIEAAQ